MQVKTAHTGGFQLFLRFLKHFALAGIRIVFFILKLPFYLLTVFAGVVDVVGFRRLEFNEMVL